eukprot:6025093-Amphidinium_carterae.1
MANGSSLFHGTSSAPVVAALGSEDAHAKTDSHLGKMIVHCACELRDPQKGSRFSRYAFWVKVCIKGRQNTRAQPSGNNE